VDNEALVASQGQKYTVGSGKEVTFNKNSEDAEAQVVAYRQKKDLGKSCFSFLIQSCPDPECFSGCGCCLKFRIRPDPDPQHCTNIMS
jgi:hypothetical protein